MSKYETNHDQSKTDNDQNRNFNLAEKAALTTAGIIGSGAAFALDTSTVTSNITAAGTSIEGVAVVMLGVVVIIWGARKVMGFFGR